MNRAALAGLLLLVCPAGPCVAQDATPAASTPKPASQTGLPLNLQMALDLGEKQNLDLAAARLQRAIASAGIRIAGEIANPAVSISATRDEPHESIFFDQEVPIGEQRGRRIAMAREEGALTDVEVAAVERRVRRQVREAFYGATLALGTTAERAEAELEVTRYGPWREGNGDGFARHPKAT